MNALNCLLSEPAVARLGWTLVHFVWQGALIGMLTAFALMLIHRRSAQLRYVVACVGLVMIAATPAVAFILMSAPLAPPMPGAIAGTISVAEPASREHADPPRDNAVESSLLGPSATVEGLPGNGTVVSAHTGPAPEQLSPPLPLALWRKTSGWCRPWLPWLVMAWGMGVILLSFRLLAGWVQVQVIRRRHVQPAMEHLQETMRELARRLRVSRPVRLLESTAVAVPVAIGWLRPVILLPAAALAGLIPEQLRAIIAHELAHIRRYDYLVNLVQTVIETVLFYHPVVWWLADRIRTEREHCCDDLAVQACDSAIGYARALAEMERLRGQPVSLAAAASGGSLTERIRRVVGLPPSHSRQVGRPLAGIVVLCVVLATAIGIRVRAAGSDTAQPTTTSAEAPATGWSRIITGRVTDAEGKPLAGATVEWGWYLDECDKRQKTTTDRDGCYRLEVTRRGASYRLGVAAEGLAPAWRDVAPDWWHLEAIENEQVPSTVDLQLGPSHRVEGVVVDAQGEPIPGVKIRALTAETGFYSSFSSPAPASPLPGCDRREATTDSRGSFRIDGLPAEHVQLQVKAAHRHVNDQNYPVDQPLRIEMSGSGRKGIIRARVIDRKTGQGVSDFTLTRRWDPEQIHLSTGDGRFTLDRDFTEGNTYSINVFSRNHASLNVKLLVTPLDTAKVYVIELDPGDPLLGRLVDVVTGKPLAGVRILYGVRADLPYFDWSAWDDYADGVHPLMGVQRAVTAADGSFAISEGGDVAKGTLFVCAAGYERVIMWPKDRPAKSADDGIVEIGMRPEAAFSGVCMENGALKAGVRISVWKQEPRSPFDETFEAVHTDAHGRYHLGSLAPGRYGLSANGQESGSFVLAPGEHKPVNPVLGPDAATLREAGSQPYPR